MANSGTSSNIRSLNNSCTFPNSFQESEKDSDIPSVMPPNESLNFSRDVNGFYGQSGFDSMSDYMGNTSQAPQASMPPLPSQPYIPYIFSQSTIEAAQNGFSKSMMIAKGSTRNVIDGVIDGMIGKKVANVNSEFISDYEVVFVGERVQRIELAITEDIELLKMKLIEYKSILLKQIEHVRAVFVGKYQKSRETT